VKKRAVLFFLSFFLIATQIERLIVNSVGAAVKLVTSEGGSHLTYNFLVSTIWLTSLMILAMLLIFLPSAKQVAGSYFVSDTTISKLMLACGLLILAWSLIFIGTTIVYA